MNPTLALALRLAVSGFCLWLALRLMPEGMGPVLGSAEPIWILVLIASNLFGIGLMATRLALINAGTGASRISAKEAVLITWAGQFGTMLGLGLVSADGIRIARLAQGHRSLPDAARLIFLDRIFGLTGLVLLALGAWAYHLAGIEPGVFAVLAVAALASAALWICWRIPALARLLPTGRLPVTMQFIALVLSVLLHGVSIAGFAAAALAIGVTPPMPETPIAVAIGLFFAILPVSIGGWGVRELAIANAFVTLGALFEAAVAASILFGMAVSLVSLPGALFLIKTRR